MNCEYINKLQKSCAFIPCYVKGKGKITKVYFIDGGFEDIDFSVGKIISDYCAINMRSIQ